MLEVESVPDRRNPKHAKRSPSREVGRRILAKEEEGGVEAHHIFIQQRRKPPVMFGICRRRRWRHWSQERAWEREE
jgi:hypothetical protein